MTNLDQIVFSSFLFESVLSRMRCLYIGTNTLNISIMKIVDFLRQIVSSLFWWWLVGQFSRDNNNKSGCFSRATNNKISAPVTTKLQLDMTRECNVFILNCIHKYCLYESIATIYQYRYSWNMFQCACILLIESPYSVHSFGWLVTLFTSSNAHIQPFNVSRGPKGLQIEVRGPQDFHIFILTDWEYFTI